MTGYRIGEGIDRHRLVAGRPFVLGGVTIPHSHGPQGHSDGDALLHAVCDALLGALALGDLGELFSDTDPAHRGRASGDFVIDVVQRVSDAGYAVINVDSTVVCEAPRLAPHRRAMREKLAELLRVEVDRVSVKATRGEGLGPEGRGESVLARAVVLLQSAEPS